MAYATDLLGPWHARYGDEFLLRSEVIGAADLLRAATSVAARLLRMEGEVGCVRPDARADLIVVDSDPFENLGVLAQGGRHVRMVLKEGAIVKDELTGVAVERRLPAYSI